MEHERRAVVFTVIQEVDGKEQALKGPEVSAMEFHQSSTTFQVALHMRPQQWAQKLLPDVNFDFFQSYLGISVETR